MIYTIIGGDGRMDTLRDMLTSRGHDVRRLCGDECESAVQESMSGAHSVILPMPATRDGVHLNCKAASPMKLLPLIKMIPEYSYIIGGMIGRAIKDELGSRVYDYSTDETLLLRGARATAEGALAIIIDNTKRTVYGSKIAVTGYGRVAREMVRALVPLGAEVTVYARRKVARDAAEAAGCRALSLDGGIERCDVIVNTIPERLMWGDAPRDAALTLDLASMQCFDADKCKKYIFAPGLPGKYSPTSAAEYLLEYIIRVMGGKA